MGLVAIIIVVAAIEVISRGESQTVAQPNPYAARLQLSSPNMSAAENYVGANGHLSRREHHQ